ncbi:MAG TPA: hypothetical protein VMT18_01495 [Planctomycetota bacterium]|nr:hypothetical protein [Planctomycetota bacterium]
MSARPGLALLLAGLLGGCYRGPAPDANPPAAGFDLAGSSERAIQIADRTMRAMGGRRRWDQTRVIAWNFLGRRRLMWDKHAQTVRIEYLDEGPALDVALHLDTRAGRAWRDGVAVTAPGELEPLLEAAYRHWVNDSYWLVMPYKLKDSGVTLHDLGERSVGARTFDVLGLTFAGVGVTPHNRYEVLVSRDRALVEQWSWFENAADPAPRFTLPWDDWRSYGGILLSGKRGDQRLTEIAVLDAPPPGMLELPRGG